MIFEDGMAFTVRSFASRAEAEAAVGDLAGLLARRRHWGPEFAWPVSIACGVDADSARAFVTVYGAELHDMIVYRAAVELGGREVSDDDVPRDYLMGLARRREVASAINAELGSSMIGTVRAEPGVMRPDGTIEDF